MGVFADPAIVVLGVMLGLYFLVVTIGCLLVPPVKRQDRHAR